MSLLRVALTLFASLPAAARAADNAPPFNRANTVAWCIVPFDGVKRTPAARAEMVRSLGITKVAYDWRAEHVADFEREILEYRRNGLEFFAFWNTHDEAFRLFAKYNLQPQIWQTAPSPEAATQEQRVAAAAARLLPAVKRARELGSRFGLYNHGGWGGEPENLVAVCEHLRRVHGADHVGIVYNFHHGHAHVDRLAAALAAMKPHLLCLNLNGMMRDGDRREMKIFPLGQGELDAALLRVAADSGYRGPVGIIGHTQDDVELRLRDNLDGLDWLAAQIEGRPTGPRPVARVPLLPKAGTPSK
jgi:hypothetical protein